MPQIAKAEIGKATLQSDFDLNNDTRDYYKAAVIREKQNLTCLPDEALNMTILGNI